MNKKNIAVFLAASVFALMFSGCADKNAGKADTKQAETSAAESNEGLDNETAETSSDGYEDIEKDTSVSIPDINADDGNMYQTFDFSFSVPDGVEYADHEDTVHENLGSARRSFSFSCASPELEITVCDTLPTRYTPELYLQSLADGLFIFDENGWDVTDYGDHYILRYCIEYGSEERSYDAAAEVLAQGRVLDIYATCGKDERETAGSIVMEIAKTAVYNGDYHYPAGEQSFEGKYFSIDCDLPWELHGSETSNLGDSSYEHAYIEYFLVDEFRKSPAELEVFAFTECSHTDAEAFADDMYISKKESKSKENVEKYSEDIKGYSAYVLTNTEDFSNYVKREKYWFFDKDGVIFEIIGSWAEGDSEQETAVMELMDALEIK